MQPTSFAILGLDLQSGDFRVTDTDAFGSAERDIKALQLAREDGAVAVFKRFKDRNINVNGYIKSTDKASAEASLDQLKTLVASANLGNLDVGYRNGIRRWNVLNANIIIGRSGQDISYIPYSMQFYSPKPYATDNTTSNIITPATLTTGSNYLAAAVLGSYPAQPVFTLTVNSISPTISSVDIIIGNSAEGRYLTIRGIRTAGDVITVDCQNKQLFINGVLTLPYGGQFPLWAPGPGTVEVSDTASTRNISISDSYPPRWL